VPFTVDGLIWAASMVVLDASRRGQPVPRLAAWSLGAGIVATAGANLAHGVGHGPVGALVSAWPALALIGSFELLMTLIRTRRGARASDAEPELRHQTAPQLEQEAPLELSVAPTVEQTVLARCEAGQSQRAIARDLDIDRRKVKRISTKQPDATAGNPGLGLLADTDSGAICALIRPQAPIPGGMMACCRSLATHTPSSTT
jgi:hypothetical protein